MSLFEPANTQRLDQDVVEQALQWMVTVQSGVSTEAELLACQHWRAQSAQHELAWQRLTGLNTDIRDSTRMLPAAGARTLLRSRNAPGRRTLLKGFAGLGVMLATGYGVRERVLLPELFSDYRTATGERRQLTLAEGVDLTLDTHTALDTRTTAAGTELFLSLGRVLVSAGDIRLSTANGQVLPAPRSRLVISHNLPWQAGTQVQVLTGSASIKLARGDSFSLNAGQQATFDSQAGSAPQPVMAGADAWVNGLLIAERMPLGQVIAQLNLYRRGVVRCDPQVAALRVSGSFSIDRPDASLDLLTRVLPIRVQRVFGYWANVVAA